MNDKITIGLLEFGNRISTIKNPMQGLIEIFDYAVLADKLNYNKFWLAELYNYNFYKAWSNPEAILPIIAGMTDVINIGIAGALVPYHNPFRISLFYKQLSNIYPDRIDLGFAKGNPSENITEALLHRHKIEASEFNDNVNEILNYFRNEEKLLDKEILIPPYKGLIPFLWNLGSSYNNLNFALENRLNFARSIFHLESNKEYQLERLQQFKEEYFNRYKVIPQVTLCISGCCHYTSTKAKKAFTNNNSIGKPTPNIVGDYSKFYDQLNIYRENYGISNFIFVNVADTTKDAMIGIEIIQQIIGT